MCSLPLNDAFALDHSCTCQSLIPFGRKCGHNHRAPCRGFARFVSVSESEFVLHRVLLGIYLDNSIQKFIQYYLMLMTGMTNQIEVPILSIFRFLIINSLIFITAGLEQGTSCV